MEQMQRESELRLVPTPIARRDRGIEDDDLGYECSHISSWRWWKNETIFVPGMGNLYPTKFAKSQIGSRFGINYDTFLQPLGGDHELIQKALQPHIDARRNDKTMVAKVIARKFEEGTKPYGVDGILRGVVGPGYAEIPDVQVLESIQKAAGDELEGTKVINYRTTDTGSSFAIVFGDTRKLDLLSHSGDEIHGGLRVWNSEVGGRSLGAAEFVWRLVCANGLIVKVDRETLLRRRHTGRVHEQLEEIFREAWEELPKRLSLAETAAHELHSQEIEDPEAEINNFARLQGQPKYIREAIKEAYKLEPIPTAYGILQAITRTSVAAHRIPDRQLDLESLGGIYLSQRSTLVA